MLLQRVIFPHRKPTRVDFEQEHTLAQGNRRHRARTFARTRSEPSRRGRKSFLLPHVSSESARDPRAAAVRLRQWPVGHPKLRATLEAIVFSRTTIEGFEVDQFFPSIGRRLMMLNARTVYRPNGGIQQILLAIEDVTRRVGLERGARGRTPAYRYADARADPPCQEQPSVHRRDGP